MRKDECGVGDWHECDLDGNLYLSRHRVYARGLEARGLVVFRHDVRMGAYESESACDAAAQALRPLLYELLVCEGRASESSSCREGRIEDRVGHSAGRFHRWWTVGNVDECVLCGALRMDLQSSRANGVLVLQEWFSGYRAESSLPWVCDRGDFLRERTAFCSTFETFGVSSFDYDEKRWNKAFHGNKKCWWSQRCDEDATHAMRSYCANVVTPLDLVALAAGDGEALMPIAMLLGGDPMAKVRASWPWAGWRDLHASRLREVGVDDPLAAEWSDFERVAQRARDNEQALRAFEANRAAEKAPDAAVLAAFARVRPLLDAYLDLRGEPALEFTDAAVLAAYNAQHGGARLPHQAWQSATGFERAPSDGVLRMWAMFVGAMASVLADEKQKGSR